MVHAHLLVCSWHACKRLICYPSRSLLCVHPTWSFQASPVDRKHAHQCMFCVSGHCQLSLSFCVFECCSLCLFWLFYFSITSHPCFVFLPVLGTQMKPGTTSLKLLTGLKPMRVDVSTALVCGLLDFVWRLCVQLNCYHLEENTALFINIYQVCWLWHSVKSGVY